MKLAKQDYDFSWNDSFFFYPLTFTSLLQDLHIFSQHCKIEK